MQKRTAKIEALNTAIALIQDEIDNPSELTAEYDTDQSVVHEYLQRIVFDLENRRDEAAYRQFKVDERKEARLEFLKAKKQQ